MSEYFAVYDPDGVLIHTTVALSPEEAARQWVESEQSMNIIYNASRTLRGIKHACASSWEKYEADGYAVVPIEITKVNQHAPNV